MASQLIAEQLVEFHEIFDLFDEDEDTILNYDEFKALLCALGRSLDDRELCRLLVSSDGIFLKQPEGFDADVHKGLGALQSRLDVTTMGIDFTDFLTIMAKKVRDSDLDEELIQAFKVFDTNNDGVISANELFTKMNICGEKLTQEEVFDMVQGADLDGDGFINYDEFVIMMTGKTKAT